MEVGQRDSHDLSLHFTTRFSVVDSMLTSLSDYTTSPQTSPHHSNVPNYPESDTNDSYASAPKGPSSNTGRHRGHTHTSSMSDYDVHVDEIASRYNAYHSRSRQNSTYKQPSKTEGKRKQSNASVRTAVNTTRNTTNSNSDMPRHMRGDSIKGSKGSGSSSVDLGYGSSMIPMASFRQESSRAASFDHSYGERVRSSPPKMLSSQLPSVPLPVDYTSMDAAPMPTIPAGPRRPTEPLSPIHLPPMTPRKVPSRKNSVKSAAGKSVRRVKSSAPVDSGDIRDQAKQFVQATNSMRTSQVGASFGAAPSPNVGTLRKAYPSSSSQPNAPKEKGPGFFRRVFGGSKHNDKQQHEDSHRPPSPAAIRPMASTSSNRPRTQPNQQHNSNQSGTASSRPSTQDASGARDQQYPPVPTLRKAHSSFFRRRKKSLQENDPPPVPTLQLPTQQSYAQLKIAPQRSPSAQSLRGAMAQYLTENATSPHETFFDSREHQPNHDFGEIGLAHGVSPQDREQQRERHAAARTLQFDRSARQGTNGEDGDRPLRTEGGGKNVSTQINGLGSQGSSSNNMRQHARLDFVGDIEGGSFLADNSSNEGMGLVSDEIYRIHRQQSLPTSAPSSKENNSPPRRANTREKRANIQMLSPISDRSYDPERPTRYLADDEDQYHVSSFNAGGEDSIKSSHSNRIWLEPSSSDERLADASRLRLPFEGPRTSERPSPVLDQLSPTSESDVFASATSLPIVQVESRELRMSQDWAETDAAKAILTHDTDITTADRERARKIFDGNEQYVTKANAAAWLGETTPKSARTRRAYMELFDFNGMNILAAFRELCSKLIVKGESQQLDRVIEAFSERWCVCNPSHGFKDRDVVHLIAYSLLMLNTDLHIADLDSRMTRTQFVKNTLPSIRSIVESVEPDASDTMRAQTRQTRLTLPWDQPSSTPASPVFPPEGLDFAEGRPSLDVKRPNRLSMRPLGRSESDGPDGSTDSCNVLVKAPYEGSMKGWEFQVEIVLKEFWTSVRQQRLPLHGAPTQQIHPQPSTSGLSVMASALRRTPSVLSKAPSDTVSYRGRTSDGGFRSATTGRFSSKPRSRPRIYPTSTIGSSRTSLDDQSVWSPAGSTWSKYSLGKTQTSMSVDSLGSHFGQGDYQQAIGFANALSQAIIREEAALSNPGSDEFVGRPLLEDESLKLGGAPWMKEGIVKHKHHLETLEKKAKKKDWSDCFAVIDNGVMRIFSFSSNSKSMRQRAKSRAASSNRGGAVGGGNWMENAEELNKFLLRQTIASVLPPPGYSKTRAHVFALSLPTGAVHLFQVGTPDIAKEFVITANYWSARLSKEPLIGGVSNVEYGWSENILNMALLSRPDSAAQNHTGPPGTASSTNSHVVVLNPGRHSSVVSPLQSPSSGIASIGRRSEDQGPGSSFKPRLPGDRFPISDWKPPTQSMMASQLMEVDQLRALTAYVENVEEELQKHNELRPLMGMAFSPRHPHAVKAMNNWEKKSAYLLRETVKFRQYIDSLTAAQEAKEKIYTERKAAGIPVPGPEHTVTATQASITPAPPTSTASAEAIPAP